MQFEQKIYKLKISTMYMTAELDAQHAHTLKLDNCKGATKFGVKLQSHRFLVNFRAKPMLRYFA